MKKSVPFTVRLTARVAFLSALAKHTGAIRDLRTWPEPHTPLNAEVERWFRTAVERQHPHAVADWFYVSVEELVAGAGPVRRSAAKEWADRWQLTGVRWITDWAVLAIVAWELAATCPLADCQSGCQVAVGGGIDDALGHASTPRILRKLARKTERVWTDVEVYQEGFGITYSISGYEPKGSEPIVPPLLGPHPLVETKDEFFRRCQDSWESAVSELAKQGSAPLAPRKLDLHCEWLVRSRICGETAADIVGSESTELSTVHKAIRAAASAIGFPAIRGQKRLI